MMNMEWIGGPNEFGGGCKSTGLDAILHRCDLTFPSLFAHVSSRLLTVCSLFDQGTEALLRRHSGAGSGDGLESDGQGDHDDG